jgi:hypothetical protein
VLAFCFVLPFVWKERMYVCFLASEEAVLIEEESSLS